LKTKEKTREDVPEKEVPVEKPVTSDADIIDVLTLRRTAREVKRYKVAMRIIGLLVIILIAIIATAYAVSYFYDAFGSFTVKVNKYDMINQGLTLSETPDYEKSIARLNADIIYDMTNISGLDIDDNVDKINGAHNGENYIAYTFYVINSGRDTITYRGELTMENVTGGVDEAVRVAVYKNGEKTVYGKTKSNGSGKESDCDKEFEASTVVMSTKTTDFESGRKDKYTVVIWLEGNDPDCVDDIVGGTMKLGMNFKIIEDT
jgi:hypothetical protein